MAHKWSYDTNTEGRQPQESRCLSEHSQRREEEASWRRCHATCGSLSRMLYSREYALQLFPFRTQEREQTTHLPVQFLLTKHLQVHTSLDLHINPIRVSNRYFPLSRRQRDMVIGRKAETEPMSSPCLQLAPSAGCPREHMSVFMRAGHCRHLPSATLHRLLQLLKFYGQS